MNLVSKEKLEKEAWKFYLVIPLWLVYFFFLPKIYSSHKIIFFLYIFFIGNFLFCLLGYLFHETWHEYLSNIDNKKLYYIYGILIFMDPQIYRIVHGSHHSKVHTYDDIEFYPIGEIKHRTFKIFYRIFEFIIGAAFIIGLQSLILPNNPKTKQKFSVFSHLISIFLILCIYSTIAALSIIFFKIEVTQLIICYLLSIWMHSFFLHQSQLSEHGFLLKEGSYKERSLITRNIAPFGFVEKLFLILTHNDPKEHVFHHTLPGEYLRPFPNTVPLPKEANIVTLKKYFKLMLRGISGEDLSE
ncbi:fatty acid desaturase [Fusobacteria bacterium ZRK30]|nr:fatty acid desaturase [Fusobacteria bacterium ZRK30]